MLWNKTHPRLTHSSSTAQLLTVRNPNGAISLLSNGVGNITKWCNVSINWADSADSNKRVLKHGPLPRKRSVFYFASGSRQKRGDASRVLEANRTEDAWSLFCTGHFTYGNPHLNLLIPEFQTNGAFIERCTVMQKCSANLSFQIHFSCGICKKLVLQCYRLLFPLSLSLRVFGETLLSLIWYMSFAVRQSPCT